MATPVTSQFPIFRDGDVELSLSRHPEDRLVLHSVILALHSPFFKAGLEQRWSQSEGIVSETIKWRYELTFDHDGTGVLCKQNTLTADDTIDDTTDKFFRRPTSTGELEVENTVTAFQATIRAHRRFFSAIYHLPLDVNPLSSYPKALTELASLATVADLYDSSGPLSAPIQAFILNNIEALRKDFVPQTLSNLHVATMFKIDWLAKDIICQFCGDRNKTDGYIRCTFNCDMANVILEKRSILRKLMEEINHELLTVKITLDKGVPESAALEFRENMIENVRSAKRKVWRDYSEVYSKVGLGWLDAWGRPPRGMNSDDLDDLILRPFRFRTMKSRVFDIVKPLFECKVSPKSNPSGHTYSSRWTFTTSSIKSFHCIEVLDSDLPWNKP
ncbi:MAG: hypothetical protein Q9222_005147 [Ikaeria aurantiellina]